ncbi:MAG: cysteine--tRNA ligase [Syntrophobacterales bacterium]|jgi:cysteinyl-tRNA synthetase|nr:cysteine--tRNA ligase [Syntrophobacterales bacterium]
MKNSCSKITEAIGNTPLIEIQRLNPNKNVRVFAKMESFNPGGSIKDRVALFMVEEAEKRGELTKDKIILEATSGNTGIGLAMVAAAKGYRLCVIMPESASEERKKILKALGAELIFTPASQGTDGAIELAYMRIRENPNLYFGTDQFNNFDNVKAHYCGTAEEIWRQTEGTVTMVVATMGTTGTLMGISKKLKTYRQDIRIVGVEPYLQHKIQGLKNMKESYRPGIYDKNLLDEKINVSDEDAFSMARRMAHEEGLFVGGSSGAAVHVALQMAKEMREGLIVAICPDGGERYLSTELFADKESSTLKLYNTLTRTKTFFRPINSEMVLIHSCGPTVHDVPHIGSLRRFVVSDMMRRYLEYKGYPVRHMINIIDIADRSIQGAELVNMDLSAYTKKNAEAFIHDMNVLNVKVGDDYPYASDNVAHMISLVEKLVEKGFAYEKLRSVYFDISKLQDYGILSNVDLKRVKHGVTVDLDDYEKDSPGDFTLLKRATLDELKRGIYFQTRWGNIRPSWHLECAAMSLASFGDTFDIHSSGNDILFPHCENVLAIGKGATGKIPANYWLNTDLVMVNGKKMSRSLENTVTIDDLQQRGFSGKDIRFFLVSLHYRKLLNFSWQALVAAKNTLKKIDRFVQRLKISGEGEGFPEIDQFLYELNKRFADEMDDDFNISGAFAAFFEFMKRANPLLARGLLHQKEKERVVAAVEKINSVLGIMTFDQEQLSEETARLLRERKILREQGNWQAADEIRKKLADMGISVYDHPHGMTWTVN